MAYVASVTTPMNGPERISRSLGLLAGKVTISSYNSTLVEITGISRYFKTGSIAGFTSGIISVACEGMSSNGYMCEWSANAKAFRAFYPTVSTTLALAVNSNVGAGAALLFESGGGAAALHATSAVGSILAPIAAAAGAEAAANDNVGDITFIAIGFI